MDFITGLPPLHGYTVVLVIVDHFSKGIHLGSLPIGFFAYKVPELFVLVFCCNHRVLKIIVFVHDMVFIKRFGSNLFMFSGTLLRMSSCCEFVDKNTPIKNLMRGTN